MTPLKDLWVLLAFPMVTILAISNVPAASAQVTPGNRDDIAELPKMAVRVFVSNIAAVDENKLSAALQRATVIFAYAGVPMTWIRCATGPGPSPCPLDDSDLVLRITHSPERKFTGAEKLGYALLAGENSRYATVFADEISKMIPHLGKYSETTLLGHAIAHELGHLLLGKPVHGSQGLMAEPWHVSELELAEKGLLQFSVTEGATMRAEVLRRATGDSGAMNRHPQVAGAAPSFVPAHKEDTPVRGAAGWRESH